MSEPGTYPEKRTYSDEEKARALELYLEYGPGQASLMCGIPKTTIGVWAHRTGLSGTAKDGQIAAVSQMKRRRETVREQVRTELLEKSMDLLNRMDEPHYDFRGKDANKVVWDKAPSSACKDYAVATAVLLDKFRLEMGETTSKAEIVGEQLEHVAGQTLDDLKERRDEMARRRRAQGAEETG